MCMLFRVLFLASPDIQKDICQRLQRFASLPPGHSYTACQFLMSFVHIQYRLESVNDAILDHLRILTNHKSLYRKAYDGRNSLVIKATDSWLACHEFESTTTEDPPCNRVMHVKSVDAPTSSRWCVGEVRREGAAQVSSSLNHDSKLRGPSPKALE
ncbi:hypothetical protein TNCV_2998961 [Trichonephila clavipes]|nr:hypothetical protein TNCV_2998961 [Trichonephila clavipes]